MTQVKDVTAEDNTPYDVLIVGAGPSGAIAAHTLATAGLRVICLEQGDWTSPTDYAANFDMWELVAREHWQPDPNHRRNLADYPVDVGETDLSPAMYSAVGGSTVHFSGFWMRLTPSDFRVKTLDGVADDWPITYEELAPFYDDVDNFLGVAGYEGDPAYPEGLSPPQPPHPLGKLGMRAAEGLNKLGWHWWPGMNAIPTQKHGSLEACARWGTCNQGCPQGAKASADRAYWPPALAAGAKLVTGARVYEISTNGEGMATGAKWVGQGGQHFTPAKHVMLCANGIGTARLLLLSKSERYPQGLANSSGLVGKNLMLHPNCGVLGYYEDDLQSWRGPVGITIGSMQFYETDKSRGFVRGAKIHAYPTPGLIFNGIDPLRTMPFDTLWGPNIHAVMRRARSAIAWAANIEDLPEETNRVTLSDKLRDSDGIRAPKVHYRYSANTQMIRAYILERLQEVHRASGVHTMLPVPVMEGEPGHLLGTARMGADPRRSVVDPMGITHDIRNLSIADGSIFVTSGAANPTSTICALALRIARNLAVMINKERRPA